MPRSPKPLVEYPARPISEPIVPPTDAASDAADVPAVANNRLHEIKSSIILQPGPAALTDGLTAMQAIIEGGQ